MGRRRAAIGILAGALLALATAAPAQAGGLKAIWGPAELPTGNASCPDRQFRCSAFPTYRKLGVDVYQFQIHWDEIAPTPPKRPRNPFDPAYRWGAIDSLVAEAGRYRIGLAALVQRAPRWANGGRAPTWAPKNPRTFADFLYAASKRYPQIKRWMIWGEPSRVENFRPMSADGAKGPRIYAELLDRSYAMLKRANPANVVIGGMTLNGGTMKPTRFLRLMKLRNGRPPRMDLWGHNPFDSRFPRLSDEPIGRYRGFNDIDTLRGEITHQYRRAHLKVPRLWLSEWTIVSDRPLELFSGFYVSRHEQAKRLRAAYRIARRTPYVVGLGWFTLTDQTEAEGNAGWGLLDSNGKPKPAFWAYKNLR
jgi:hypothetical protein